MLEHDGTPSATSLAATKSAEIRLYTAAVLRHLPEKPLQLVPMGQVFLEPTVLRGTGYPTSRRGARDWSPTMAR